MTWPPPYPEHLFPPDHWAQVEELQRALAAREAPFRTVHLGTDFTPPARPAAFSQPMPAPYPPATTWDGFTRAELADIVGDGPPGPGARVRLSGHGQEMWLHPWEIEMIGGLDALTAHGWHRA